MLAQMMKPHNLYSVTETKNANTYEMEKTKTLVKQINVAIVESGYQQYLSNNMDLQQYSYIGFTFDDGDSFEKGMYVDGMEIVHVLPTSRQTVLYLKAVG